jgi:hypothetical protein
MPARCWPNEDTDMNRISADTIASAVMAHFLSTGQPVRVSELAKQLGTTAKRIADSTGDEYEYVEVERQTGPWYNTRTVTSWAVTPTKLALRRAILGHSHIYSLDVDATA